MKWLSDIVADKKSIFAGIKRILTGFLFFVCCLSVYFGISALLSQFFYERSSTAQVKEISIVENTLSENSSSQDTNLLMHKSLYEAADMRFSAYVADHDPFFDLENEINTYYQHDTEFLSAVHTIHKALDSFLKKEIPGSALIYADNGIHFTQENKAFPFVVYQLVHSETPAYMYFLGEENEAFFEKLKNYLKAQNLPCSVHFENSFYYVMYKGQITQIFYFSYFR